MKVVYTMAVTDADVKSEVNAMMSELEEDDVIRFPDAKSREDFINEVTDIICDKYEERELYTPNYEAEILDLARFYGYKMPEEEPDTELDEASKWLYGHSRGDW